MVKKPAKTETAGQRRLRALEIALLGMCLGILALRVTYTEAPTAQVTTLPGSLSDTVYSLTLSGLLLFAFVFWLLGRILSGRLTYRMTGMEIGLVLFATAAVVATLGASDKRAAITQSAVLLGPIFGALLLAQILDSPARVRAMLAVVAALGVVCAYLCAEQLFISNAITIEQYEKQPQMLLGPLGIEPGTFQHFLFEHRLYSRGVRGSFTTSNSAASFAILASFAALGLLVRRLRDRGEQKVQRHYNWLLAGGAVIVVVGLLLTQSKGGILAFFAGLALLAVLVGIDRWLATRKRLVVTALASLVLLAGVGIGSAGVLYGLKHGRLPGGNSMLVRWQYWAASARMYADHPWAGVGPGNFSDYYPHYKPAAALESVSDPHSFLLSLITQYGPLGLLGFLAMICVPLWRSITFPSRLTATDDAPAPPFKALALGMLCAVGACLLLVRPFLMPPSQVDDPDILLYEIVTLYLAPAAAFLIGFLLLSAPLDDRRGWHTPGRCAALSAALACAVLAVLLHNLIDFALFEPGVWITFWFLLACLSAVYTQRNPSSTSDPVPAEENIRVAASSPKGLGMANASTLPLHAAGRRSLSLPGTPPVKTAAVGIAVLFLAAYGWLVWKPAYDTTVTIRRAQQATAGGHFDEAHRILEAAMDVDPLSPVIPTLSGRVYLLHYERAAPRQPALLEKAARCFQKAIDLSPADYKSYEKLAITYGWMGEKQKTYNWYRRAADLYPGCDRLWFELARAADGLGKTAEALDAYRKAVAIEDAYRRQFRQMYPNREKIVSRLGEAEYQLAQKRIRELSATAP
jgi:O-antigen ligase